MAYWTVRQSTLCFVLQLAGPAIFITEILSFIRNRIDCLCNIVQCHGLDIKYKGVIFQVSVRKEIQSKHNELRFFSIIAISYSSYHRSRNFFFCTQGLVNAIPSASTRTVDTSCTLLKFSLNTSNVFEGATRVQNKSSPYASTRDVDSRRAGEVMICRVWAT